MYLIKFLYESCKLLLATWRQIVERLFQDFKNEALRDILRQLANSDLHEEKADGIIFRLDQLYYHAVHLVRLCSIDLISNGIEQLITNTVMLLLLFFTFLLSYERLKTYFQTSPQKVSAILRHFSILKQK